MHTPDGRRDFLKQLAAVAGGLWGIPELTRPGADAGRPGFADGVGVASPVAAPRRLDAFTRLPLGDVRLGGRLGHAIDLCVRNRVMAQDGEHLVEPFRQRRETNCWSSEFWGKWFLSAVSAQRYTQDPTALAAVEQSARSLMATQSSDGYMGTYAPQNHLATWDVWGRKYTLLGLLAYHDLTGDRAALESARRLADHLLTEVGPGRASIVKNGAYRGMASSSILEPIVLLYNRTGDARYLAFAEHIVAQWETPDGPRLISKALAGVPVAERFPPPAKWFTWENGQKAYEMMSCYEGLLELYRVTGNPDHLAAVVKTYENIRDTEINVAGSGASMECWYGGAARQTVQARHMMETCVTMTWMKLGQNLLRLTGDPRIADDIERSAYNALLASMLPDGSSFAKYSPLAGHRALGEIQCDSGLNCCTANGPRGLLLLPETAVMTAADGVVVNLYTRSIATAALPGGGHARIEQETDYPVSSTVALRIMPDRSRAFALRLRIPAWSARSSVTVNGASVADVRPGEYARIERTWRAGDEVRLELDLRARVVRVPGARDRHVAVVRGPVVLARDSRLGGDVDEVASLRADAEGHVALESASTRPDSVWMAFSTPFEQGLHDAKGELFLTDYSSAGNAWNETSRFRVWLPQILDPSRNGGT
ncbi:MAG: hypothetical protein DMD35_21515 [Gemmatimonadetes bacterium]|nr:MAG: hypothetical protein DMD35_21515 [Gemmatimonadota bacterium]